MDKVAARVGAPVQGLARRSGLVARASCAVRPLTCHATTTGSSAMSGQAFELYLKRAAYGWRHMDFIQVNGSLTIMIGSTWLTFWPVGGKSGRVGASGWERVGVSGTRGQPKANGVRHDQPHI